MFATQIPCVLNRAITFDGRGRSCWASGRSSPAPSGVGDDRGDVGLVAEVLGLAERDLDRGTPVVRRGHGDPVGADVRAGELRAGGVVIDLVLAVLDGEFGGS